MISKQNDYDNVSVYSEFKALPPGGYICQILGAKEQKNRNGGDMLVVMLDISDGEYSNYFMDLWEIRKKKSDDSTKVKFPNDAIGYINILDQDGKTNRKFKSFCTSVEESGGQVWDDKNNLMIDNLKGEYVGAIFRREQHEYNGKMYWNTKIFGFRSVETIQEGNYTIPDDLYAETQNISEFEPPTDTFAAVNDDVPF